MRKIIRNLFWATAIVLVAIGIALLNPFATEHSTPKAMVFHAKWCHWCPTDAEIAAWQRDYPGIKIVDVDIDKEPELAKEFHVKRIPRFLFCDENGCRTTNNTKEFESWLQQYGATKSVSFVRG